ncbi:hypothetical protein pb186bvf_015610 [Paramecium bursaria]
MIFKQIRNTIILVFKQIIEFKQIFDSYVIENIQQFFSTYQKNSLFDYDLMKSDNK